MLVPLIALSLEDIKVCNGYVSLPYKDDKTQWIKHESNMLYRPNHGLVHSVRCCGYLHHVIPLFAQHAKDEGLRLFCNEIIKKPTELQKLALSVLFTDTGRESESNLNRYILNYKAASARNLELYLRQKFPNLDSTEYQKYGEICYFLNNNESANLSANQETRYLQILASLANDLDLQRCCEARDYQRAMSYYCDYIVESENAAKSLLTLQRFATLALQSTSNQLRCEFTDAGWLSSKFHDYSSSLLDYSQPEQAFAYYKILSRQTLPQLRDSTVQEYKQFILAEEPFLFKVIRADERDYWSNFIDAFVYGQKHQLRKMPQVKRYTSRLSKPDASGERDYEIVDIANREPYLTLEIKRAENWMKPNSATGVDPTNSSLPAYFGQTRDSCVPLIGIRLSLKDAIFYRLMQYDEATQSRPYAANSFERASVYLYKKLQDKKYHFSFTDLFNDSSSQYFAHNEIMARMRANPDGSLQVVIFNDSLDSRLLAQVRAIDLHNCLQEKLGREIAPIPISFYSQDKTKLRYYSDDEQKADKENHAEFKNRYNLFLKHYDTKFSNVSTSEWIMLLPLIFNLGNGTQRIAFNALYEKIRINKKFKTALIKDYLNQDDFNEYFFGAARTVDVDFFIKLLANESESVLSTIIHAVRHQPILLHSLLKHYELSEADVDKVLQSLDDKILSQAMARLSYFNLKDFKEFLELLQKYKAVNNSRLLEILKLRLFYTGDNLLIYLARNQPMAVQYLLDALQSNESDLEQNISSVLMIRNDNYYNVLMVAAECQPFAMYSLIDNIINLSCDGIKHIINNYDCDTGETAMMKLALNSPHVASDIYTKIFKSKNDLLIKALTDVKDNIQHISAIGFLAVRSMHFECLINNLINEDYLNLFKENYKASDALTDATFSAFNYAGLAKKKEILELYKILLDYTRAIKIYNKYCKQKIGIRLVQEILEKEYLFNMPVLMGKMFHKTLGLGRNPEKVVKVQRVIMEYNKTSAESVEGLIRNICDGMNFKNDSSLYPCLMAINLLDDSFKLIKQKQDVGFTLSVERQEMISQTFSGSNLRP